MEELALNMVTSVKQAVEESLNLNINKSSSTGSSVLAIVIMFNSQLFHGKLA